MEPDNQSFGGWTVKTVHVDAMVVEAWNAEARRTGQRLEAIVRESLDLPAGRLVVVAVNMTTHLDEHLTSGVSKPGRPWQELLQAAFADAVRLPPEGQP